MAAGVVIIGGGQAGYQCAASLRELDYPSPIHLITAEPSLPYQRPPLSKAFLKGEYAEADLLLRQQAFYTEQNIHLQPNNPAVAINTSDRSVALQDGTQLSYEYLVYATGAPALSPPIAGIDSDGVHLLRDLQQAKALKQALSTAKNLVVIGGGFIGMEVAAAARSKQINVTVFEAQERILARVTAPIVSDFITRQHQQQGVDVRVNSLVAEIESGDGGQVVAVRDQQGQRIPADLVVVGVGVKPEIALAQAAGLDCDNGVLVDEYCRSSDALIFAIGDVANHINLWADRRIRLESIQNATDQARAVAQSISGQDGIYRQVPWFWTEQYSLRLQMVGLSDGYTDTVVRGDIDAGRFSVFYYRQDKLIAIDSINRPVDHMGGRNALAKHLSPTKEQAADERFNLKKLK